MDRNTLLWAMVVFFGASILFAAVRDAAKDEGTGVALLAQVAVGALLVGAIVVYIRRRG